MRRFNNTQNFWACRKNSQPLSPSNDYMPSLLTQLIFRWPCPAKAAQNQANDAFFLQIKLNLYLSLFKEESIVHLNLPVIHTLFKLQKKTWYIQFLVFFQICVLLRLKFTSCRNLSIHNLWKWMIFLHSFDIFTIAALSIERSISALIMLIEFTVRIFLSVIIPSPF